MSDIEALLSVDAGRVPPGMVAFFLEDVGRRKDRLQVLLAVILAVGALGCGIAGGGRIPVTLLLLGAAGLAILATPTIEEDENRPVKRRVMVVTPHGLIVRDDQGLHRWEFADLADVEAIFDHEPHLDIIDRKGKRHMISYCGYRRGQKFCQVVARRLHPPPAEA